MKTATAYGSLGRMAASDLTSRLISCMIKPGIAVCLLLCSSGCATTFTKGLIDDISSHEMEFVYAEQRHLWEEPFRGSFIGTLKENEITYNVYQFTNLLIGTSTRILELRIPHSPVSGRGLVLETDTIKPKLAPAYVLIAFMHHMRSYSPEHYFRQRYPKFDPTDYASHTMHLSSFYHQPYYVTAITRNEDTGELEWVQHEVDVHIRWDKRSRTVYALSHLAYIVAVPIDVVTSPLQLIFFIYMMVQFAM